MIASGLAIRGKMKTAVRFQDCCLPNLIISTCDIKNEHLFGVINFRWELMLQPTLPELRLRIIVTLNLSVIEREKGRERDVGSVNWVFFPHLISAGMSNWIQYSLENSSLWELWKSGELCKDTCLLWMRNKNYETINYWRVRQVGELSQCYSTFYVLSTLADDILKSVLRRQV